MPLQSPSSTSAAVTVFLCTNCARPGAADFGWPWPVREIPVPCTGRLQPEHVLKAFESGADLVCAIGCDEDECHYLEGSKRRGHRVEYVRSILRDIGLGGERLLFFRAPGAALPDQVRLALESLPPNPLHRIQTDKEVVNSCLEGDNAED